jgi:hypothetical protein
MSIVLRQITKLHIGDELYLPYHRTARVTAEPMHDGGGVVVVGTTTGPIVLAQYKMIPVRKKDA